MIARTPKSSKSAKTGRSRQSVTGKPTTGKPTTEPRLSRQRKPAQMPVADWQRTLRRQFARDQGFELVNLSRDKPAPIFSDYSVFNPDSGGRYRVSIRGTAAGDNLCTCLDYATNELGTCKHIEFALVRLMARRGAKAALQRGYAPVFSEVYLHQAGQRTVRFRASSECPVALLKRTGQLFDAAAGWILPWARLGDLDAFIAAAQRDSFSAGHELRIDARALAFVAQVRDGERRQQLLAAAYPKGAAEVLMNGTRLATLMQSVDKATAALGVAEDAAVSPMQHAPPLREPAPQTAPAPQAAQADARAPVEVSPPPEPQPAAGAPTAAADPWAPLLEAGLNWLDILAAPGAANPDTPAAGPRITVDPVSGQQRLSLPMPDPATVQRLAAGLAGLRR